VQILTMVLTWLVSWVV